MSEGNREVAARSSIDDVIEVYKRDVDRTLLRENLRKSPTERLEALQARQRFGEELARAEREARHRRG
ncbi:MAG: hypothetical protein HYU52_03225 [Acidobacteria bacterium]|nr:hypothetical protein [Acidobacteriota bacterium]